MPRSLPLVLFLAFPLFAQQRPTLQERVEVRLIEVDVVVTDKEGKSITGLGPDDFDLFENRKRQPITNFSEYRDTEVTAIAVPAAPAATTPARPEPRTIVFLIDTLQIRGERRTSLFSNLRSLAQRIIREGDRAQVLQWHDMAGVRILAPPTTNRADIEHAFNVAEKALEAPMPGGPSIADQAAWFRSTAATPDMAAAAEGNIESSIRQGAEEDLARMRRKTAAMQRILSSLTDPNRRSTFIYVSDDFPMSAGKRFFIGRRAAANIPDDPLYSTRSMLEAIIRVANAHGIVFYGLRPEIPWTGGSFGTIAEEQAIAAETTPGTEALRDQIILGNELTALSLVAEATGGSIAVGPGGMDEAVDAIARDLGSYYTLAYRVTTDGSDRERRVQVRAKNREHVVRARTSLVDRSEKTRARDLLIARLFENGPAGDIDFDITTRSGRPVQRGRFMIPVELSIPVEDLRFEEEGEEIAAKFSVLAVAGANIGQITRVTEDSRRVAAPARTQPQGVVTYRFELLADPRPTMVAIAVFDEKSGLAGTRSIVLARGQAEVQTASGDPGAEAAWQQALERAEREKKVIVAFMHPKRCRECATFERESISHPTIQRRLPSVVFVQIPATAGAIEKQWNAKEAGVALFDRNGVFRARWIGVPDTTSFGAILDGIIAVAPQFERAVRQAEVGGPDDGEVEAAIGLARLGRTTDARAALERAIANGSPETRQHGLIVRAMLEAGAGNRKAAIAELDGIIASAITPEIAGDAWTVLGVIHRSAGEHELAINAFTNASAIVAPDSPTRAAAEEALQQLRATQHVAQRGPISIVPIGRPVVSGRQLVKTTVGSAAITRVTFAVDGQVVQTADRPPFSARLDLGEIPQRRTIRVVAYAQAREVGRDELVVNDAGETFSLRMTEPREGPVSGAVRVTMTVRAPALSAVRRVVVTWNDAERAILASPPWQAVIHVPEGQLGVLRAVAELDNGRSAEDAVLLNASGAVEHAEVQLLEVPITVTGRENAAPSVEARDIVVTEAGKRRAVESLAGSADTPLTIGLLLDSSASMQTTLPDVQEAALRFLDTVMTDRDRAFLVTFDSNARIVQAPTSDRALLRKKIMSIIPDGLTALHDALALGLLQFEGVKGRRALVVFTDGIDRTSRYGPDDVAELARRMNVPIQLVAARTSAPPTSPSTAMLPSRPGSTPIRSVTVHASTEVARAYRVLETLTASTGGATHILRKLDELPEVYERIGAALRSQMLAFVRIEPGTRENEWREIRVGIRGGRFEVRAPEGYYAPW
jgi:Ca-activated chloride channel homolog